VTLRTDAIGENWGGVWEKAGGTATEFHHPFPHNQRAMHITPKETLTAIYSITVFAKQCPSPATFLLKTDSTVPSTLAA